MVCVFVCVCVCVCVRVHVIERHFRCFLFLTRPLFISVQTDVRVFHDMKAVIHTGANTTRVDTTTSSSNTTTPTINHTGVNTTVLENTQTPSTPKTSADKAVNTPDKSAQLSMSKVEYVEVAAEAPKRPLTRQEQIIQRGANQAFAFLGSTSSSGSLSPTSPKGLFSIPGEESVTESEARLTHSSPALQVTESKQPGEVLDVSEDVKESESFTMESGEKSVHAGVEMEKDSSVQVPASEQSTQEDEMALGESAADQGNSLMLPLSPGSLKVLIPGVCLCVCVCVLHVIVFHLLHAFVSLFAYCLDLSLSKVLQS